MVYYGTDTVERIAFHPICEPECMNVIELAKLADTPMFVVTCDYDPNWRHEFYLDNNSDYERVKMNIMDVLFDAGSTDEALEKLTEIFEDGFTGILADNDHECKCEHCTCLD